MVAAISVIIPNFNGIHLLPLTLPSVKEALYNSGKPCEIIIIDDCSTDDSVNYLKQHHPDIKIILNNKNSGFSITANKGIFAAAYDKVLLLNSDVKLTPDYFKNQLRYFDKPDTFGVMGRIVGWDDDNIQDGAKLPSYHGSKIKTSRNYLLKDKNMMNEGLYSMYLSGANAFIDKEKFILLNGLNEMFSPFYVEDYELSMRAWRLGFKCYYDYNSVCRHQVSTSIKLKSRKRYIKTIYDRNKMFLHALHLEGIQKILWFFQLIPETLIHLFNLKWNYFTSLWMFFNAFDQIKNYQLQFDELAIRIKCRKTVGEVTSFILNNIQGEKIVL